MYRIILIVFLVVFLGGLSPQLQAQSKTTEETDPTAASETVCYAADDKWICASKDQEALARQQASTVNQQQQPETTEEPEPTGVQITTVQPVPSFEDVEEAEPQVVQPQNSEAEQQQTETVAQTPPVVSEPVTDRERLINEAEQARTNQQTESVQNTPTTTSSSDPDEIIVQWQRNYPNDWTVQVIGLSNVQNLDQFFNQYGLNRNDFLIVETVVEAGPWWIVIFEHFPNRDAAVAAKARLPSAVANQAWVRPINAIPLP